jgi:hypothetical protein
VSGDFDGNCLENDYRKHISLEMDRDNKGYRILSSLTITTAAIDTFIFGFF